MSDMNGKNKLQVPEELLKQVTGGFTPDQLTPEEYARMKKLADDLAYAYIHESQEEVQKIIDLMNAFGDEMTAKYGPEKGMY